MKHTFTYVITEKDAGRSAADFLRSRGFSRHLLIGMKHMEDGILVNGIRAYASCPLRCRDELCVTLPLEEGSEHIPPVPLPINIVYEDNDLMVLNKPYDMPIHPSMGNYENTLANGLAWYFKKQDQDFVFRCINRLDRDTSGLLIVAKHALSGAILSDQMKHRQIRREYLAVAKGITPPRGTINAPIGRVSDSVIERCVDEENGETAITHYERLAVSHNQKYSLLKISLETGRTHQIRVHMKHIGHSLPGDYLYCPDYSDYKRQPLHSLRLSFLHPITGTPLSFHTGIPEDFHPEFFTSDP